MKSIIYVSALLMASAAVYGFVDYKKTSSDEKFKKLYEHRKPVHTEEVKPSPSIAVLPGLKEEVLVEDKKSGKASKASLQKDEKKAVRKSKVTYKEFSRAAMEQVLPVAIVDTAEVEMQD
jgi:hypothetical protein